MKEIESSMERYFKEYRRKLNEVKQIRVEHRDLSNQVVMMADKLTHAERELHGMKRVISKMIDEDLDPVEAKLSIDDSDEAGIWQNQTVDITYDASPSYGGSIDTWSTVNMDTISFGIKT